MFISEGLIDSLDFYSSYLTNTTDGTTFFNGYNPERVSTYFAFCSTLLAMKKAFDSEFKTKINLNTIWLPSSNHVCLSGAGLNQYAARTAAEAANSSVISGVYVWTHIPSGNQYVGSSSNLGRRLISYFRPSYHTAQLTRLGGTVAISRAMTKYPDFTTQWSLDIYFTTNYLYLEQFILSTFACIFNARRVATTGPYVPNTASINVGEANPSFGLTGYNAMHWGVLHSADVLAEFSAVRSSTYYLYDSATGTPFIRSNSEPGNGVGNTFLGLASISSYFNIDLGFVKKIFARSFLLPVGDLNFIISTVILTPEEVFKWVERITIFKGSSWANGPLYVYNSDCTQLLASFEIAKIYFLLWGPALATMNRYLISATPYQGFFFSNSLIESSNNSLIGVPEFKGPAKTMATVAKPIYGFNPTTKEYQKWSSARACLADLENNSNFNQGSLLLRIKHNQLYHGFFVSFSPFDN